MVINGRLHFVAPRGQVEYFNKGLTTGFGLEQLPWGESGATAMFFRIGGLAYTHFMGSNA